ncbi:hypothetical protein MA16_Dca007409 [Dendrobium catenatum]|uniref:Uncharacterized protein n=1 Tax=Dendrobium catenatum TaxID=906689 RepID=A0A2I0W8R3_9ASPA|nr:hypothetical protein MA16_Dca007409 [Dendrobium catenatum]
MVFDDFPSYCSHCKQLGHSKLECSILHPHSTPTTNVSSKVDVLGNELVNDSSDNELGDYDGTLPLSPLAGITLDLEINVGLANELVRSFLGSLGLARAVCFIALGNGDEWDDLVEVYNLNVCYMVDKTICHGGGKRGRQKSKRKPEIVLLEKMQPTRCLENSMEFLKRRKMKVSRSNYVIINAKQAFRLLFTPGNLLSKGPQPVGDEGGKDHCLAIEVGKTVILRRKSEGSYSVKEAGRTIVGGQQRLERLLLAVDRGQKDRCLVMEVRRSIVGEGSQQAIEVGKAIVGLAMEVRRIVVDE